MLIKQPQKKKKKKKRPYVPLVLWHCTVENLPHFGVETIVGRQRQPPQDQTSETMIEDNAQINIVDGLVLLENIHPPIHSFIRKESCHFL